MTLGELKNEIFNLNWENQAEYDENPNLIPQAINRAMSIITTEVRPIYASFSISQHPLENIGKNTPRAEKAIEYDGAIPLEFEAITDKAQAFCFACDGVGVAVLIDEDGEREIPLLANRQFRTYRGFCKGRSVLSFKGEHSYLVKNIAFYDRRLSLREEDIPSYERYSRYDLKRLIEADGENLFLGIEDEFFDGLPSLTHSKAPSFYREGRDVLLIPKELECELRVRYRKGFTRVTPLTEDSFTLEPDEEVLVLLPLLSAYFIWLDDEKNRAQEYYTQYEIRRDAILQRDSRATAVIIGGGCSL